MLKNGDSTTKTGIQKYVEENQDKEIIKKDMRLTRCQSKIKIDF